MNFCIHWPSCANHAPIMVYLLKMNSAVPSEHERARVLRTALAVLQRHVTAGTLVKGAMTTKARSLVPLGAGTLPGLTARPYFTRRQAMREQL